MPQRGDFYPVMENPNAAIARLVAWAGELANAAVWLLGAGPDIKASLPQEQAAVVVTWVGRETSNFAAQVDDLTSAIPRRYARNCSGQGSASDGCAAGQPQFEGKCNCGTEKRSATETDFTSLA